MRLIGLLCVTLLLAALATLAYEQRETYLPELTSMMSPDGVIEHDLRWTRGENYSPLRGTITSVPYRSTDSWIGLSGFDSFGRAEFPLPSSTIVGAGEVLLNLTSELETGAVARLRFNVNGTRRAEIVLQGGVKRHQVLFPLKESDLISRRVVLTMAIEGAAPKIICQADWDSGAIVQLEPTSHLLLSTGAPIDDPLDKLLLSGLPAQVVWPTQDDAGHKAALMSLAALYGPISFVKADDAEDVLTFSEVQARQMLEEHRPLHAGTNTWPVPLDQVGGNTALRPMLGMNTWRISFDRRMLPGQGQPSSLNFGLRIAGMTVEDWLLTVTQDDKLVHSETLTGKANDLQKRIALQDMGPGFEGTVDVSLSRRSDGQGNCNDLPPAVGQITELSALAGTPAPEYLGGLFSHASGQFYLVPDADLSAREATIASAILRSAFPANDMQFTGTETEESSTIAILPATEIGPRLRTLLAAAPTARHWVIWLSSDENGAQSPNVQLVEDGELSRYPASDRTVVLVTRP